MATSMDAEQLRRFSPFDTLESANLNDLLNHIDIRQASAGDVLFSTGDTDKNSIYVLAGTLSLRNDGQVLGTIEGGTEEARNPVAPKLPRHLSAVAVDQVEYFSIDSDLVDTTLTLDHTGLYEVGDFNAELGGEDGDWMSALLRAKIFEHIPPQSIQMIFMRLNRVDFKAGDTVIKQGTQGDDFFIIRSGECLVMRETAGTSADICLAELGVGDSFGEEALLSNEKRSATVVMRTDGILMRLGRDDFQSLLNEPLVMTLEPEQAETAITHGGKWLDVRVPSEFLAFRKEDAINLPLYLLRHKIDMLDRNTPYIVCCDTGRRSSAAAFILNQIGFETAVLKGGLNHC
ncbi:MAG: cyclic nucleotide-binding domain-containing protein [Pseudomonadota bacterium]